MKIFIKEDENNLVLSNEQLDNSNYVEIIVEDKEDSKGMMIPVDELYAAIQSFMDLRNIQDERERKYTN